MEEDMTKLTSQMTEMQQQLQELLSELRDKKIKKDDEDCFSEQGDLVMADADLCPKSPVLTSTPKKSIYSEPTTAFYHGKPTPGWNFKPTKTIEEWEEDIRKKKEEEKRFEERKALGLATTGFAMNYYK